MGIVKRNQLTESRISGGTEWGTAVEKMPEEGGRCAWLLESARPALSRPGVMFFIGD